MPLPRCPTCCRLAPHRLPRHLQLASAITLTVHHRSLPHTPPTLYTVEWGQPDWTWGYTLDPTGLDTDSDGVESSVSQLRASFAGEGLLDGFTFNATDGSDLNNSLYPKRYDLANDNYAWNGSQWTLWHGEANWSTDPLANDTDNDTLEDGAELNGTAFVGGQWRTFNPTDPASNDTDGDGINDKLELIGYSGPKGNYTLDPSQWSTDGDNISDKMEVDGWSYYVIKYTGYKWVIEDGHSVLRKAFGQEERTAYGDPKKLFTLGDNGQRLNDTVKFEHGGNPWVDDSDGDGIPDFDDIDLTDENDAGLFVKDAEAPQIKQVELKAERDGWDLYIEIKAYITDNYKPQYVQMELSTPGEHDRVAADPVVGSPGWYSARFSTGAHEWVQGNQLLMEGHVIAQDFNYNINTSFASKRGVLGDILVAYVQWVDGAKEEALATAKAMGEALNALKNFIIEKIKAFISNTINPLIDDLKQKLENFKQKIIDVTDKAQKEWDNIKQVSRETATEMFDFIMGYLFFALWFASLAFTLALTVISFALPGAGFVGALVLGMIIQAIFYAVYETLLIDSNFNILDVDDPNNPSADDKFVMGLQDFFTTENTEGTNPQGLWDALTIIVGIFSIWFGGAAIVALGDPSGVSGAGYALAYSLLSLFFVFILLGSYGKPWEGYFRAFSLFFGAVATLYSLITIPKINKVANILGTISFGLGAVAVGISVGTEL